MKSIRRGLITKLSGNMVMAEVDGYVVQNEVAYVIHGEERLKAEVIRIRGNQAELQVYEETGGLGIGETVVEEFQEHNA